MEENTKANKLLWGLAALLYLGTYNSGVAQQPAGSQLEATARVGEATVGVPSVVVLKNVPQATAQIRTPARAGAAVSRIPRPQTGLTEAQWKALKEQAAKWPDPNGGAASTRVPSLFPSPTP
jgi:hypothetical protein